MAEIGKILRENRGKPLKKTGKTDFEHPLKQCPRHDSGY